jgi:hypothetical protein
MLRTLGHLAIRRPLGHYLREYLMLYTAGTLVTVTGTFMDTTDALADPTTVVLKYSQAGTTVVTTVTPALISTGVYSADIDTTGFGTVQVLYEFIGTGAVQVSGVGEFDTEALPF